MCYATQRLDDLGSGWLNFDFASLSGDADIDASIEGIPVAVVLKTQTADRGAAVTAQIACLIRP